MSYVKILTGEEDAGFSLSTAETGSVDHQGNVIGAMGGTEMMRKRLYDSLGNEFLDNFQIISSRVRDIDPNKPTILWCHDLAEDPEVQKLKDPEYRKQFALFVFVSHYQFESYRRVLGIPYEQSIVLKNAIEPIPNQWIRKSKEEEPIRLIYHTTPHRGLELLVAAFEAVQKKIPNTILDVYSSFEIYGWGERDKQFEAVFERCQENPSINYHGYKSNDHIRLACAKADIFAYPCIWEETSCIAAIEAMSAQCIVVHPNFGALPETLADFSINYPYIQDPKVHASIFANVLAGTLQNCRDIQATDKLSLQKAFADTTYNWEQRATHWHHTLNGILRYYKAQ